MESIVTNTESGERTIERLMTHKSGWPEDFRERCATGWCYHESFTKIPVGIPVARRDRRFHVVRKLLLGMRGHFKLIGIVVVMWPGAAWRSSELSVACGNDPHESTPARELLSRFGGDMDV
jgi:hypothetical protein